MMYPVVLVSNKMILSLTVSNMSTDYLGQMYAYNETAPHAVDKWLKKKTYNDMQDVVLYFVSTLLHPALFKSYTSQKHQFSKCYFYLTLNKYFTSIFLNYFLLNECNICGIQYIQLPYGCLYCCMSVTLVGCIKFYDCVLGWIN